MSTDAPNLADHRFRWEAKRAIDMAGVTMPEMLAPASLCAQPGDGEVILTSEGVEVGRIPLHRLGPIDLDRVYALALASAPELAQVYGLDCAALVAALEARSAVVWEPDDGDFVWVSVMPRRTYGPTTFGILRHKVVPGWPPSDWPTSPTSDAQ